MRTGHTAALHSAPITLSLLCALLFAATASAQFQSVGIRPQLLKDVGLTQELGQQVPLDLQFVDEQGHLVTLSQYFGSKPVILTLVYYQCPMLCTQVLNNVLQSIKDIPLQLGRDYEIVTVSIDPRDRPVEAQAKQIMYTGLYERDRTKHGWHFLTGADPQIHQLADAVGFRYAYDPQSGQYAHPAAIMVLTPSGKVSRYFYGIAYHATDLRLGLVDASSGSIGSAIDAVLLYCCSYDPATGRYSLIISRIISAAGALTVLALALLIFYLRRAENYAISGKHA